MKKLEQPLISIIVPVYKVEKYLKRCVDSILTQTYQNMEVILVDDGSPDNCGAICDRYKETDNRVVVIHKKNGGLSDARNAAIPLAKGEYISFIDAEARKKARIAAAISYMGYKTLAFAYKKTQWRG